MRDYRAIVDDIRGPLVPILPAFAEDDALDIDSTCNWVDWLIGEGIRLFWTTQGTTHFWCLTDAEVRDLTRALAQVTRGRAVLIASSRLNWSTRETIEFVHLAAEWGADIAKLQVDWSFNPKEDLVFEHYRAVAQASPIPLFAYTAAVPAVTGGMSTELLKRILDLPQFVGMKNDSGDFYEHASYLRAIREHGARFTPVTGGSMESFLHGHPFGARAFAVAVGIAAPQIPIAFHRRLEEGDQAGAVEIVRKHEQPIVAAFSSLGPALHLSCWRVAAWLKGRFASYRTRFPLRALTAEEVEWARRCLADAGLL
jgi:4-hydroxy-tetrahydrodipicolinate synthase